MTTFLGLPGTVLTAWVHGLKHACDAHQAYCTQHPAAATLSAAQGQQNRRRPSVAVPAGRETGGKDLHAGAVGWCILLRRGGGRTAPECIPTDRSCPSARNAAHLKRDMCSLRRLRTILHGSTAAPSTLNHQALLAAAAASVQGPPSECD